MFSTKKYYSVMAPSKVRLMGPMKPTGRWLGTLMISKPASIDYIAPAGTEIHQNETGWYLVSKKESPKKIFLDNWDQSKVIQIRSPLLKM